MYRILVYQHVSRKCREVEIRSAVDTPSAPLVADRQLNTKAHHKRSENADAQRAVSQWRGIFFSSTWVHHPKWIRS